MTRRGPVQQRGLMCSERKHFYRTISGVRLFWDLEEPKQTKGPPWTLQGRSRTRTRTALGSDGRAIPRSLGPLLVSFGVCRRARSPAGPLTPPSSHLAHLARRSPLTSLTSRPSLNSRMSLPSPSSLLSLLAPPPPLATHLSRLSPPNSHLSPLSSHTTPQLHRSSITCHKGAGPGVTCPLA